MHVTDQVLRIYAGTHGALDKVPVAEVHAWEKAFHAFLREQKRQSGRRSPTPGTSTSPRPPNSSWPWPSSSSPKPNRKSPRTVIA